jgi:hypothetical protein
MVHTRHGGFPPTERDIRAGMHCWRCSLHQYQLERNKHAGPGADSVDPCIGAFKGSCHWLGGLDLQQSEVTGECRGNIHVRHQPQLLWVKWHSQDICAIVISLKAKINLSIHISSSHSSFVALKAMKELEEASL